MDAGDGKPSQRRCIFHNKCGVRDEAVQVQPKEIVKTAASFCLSAPPCTRLVSSRWQGGCRPGGGRVHIPGREKQDGRCRYQERVNIPTNPQSASICISRAIVVSPVHSGPQRRLQNEPSRIKLALWVEKGRKEWILDGQPDVSSLIEMAELKSATISLTSGIGVSLGGRQICAFGKYFDDLLRVEDSTQRTRSVWKWHFAALAVNDSHGNLEVWGCGEEKRKKEKRGQLGRRVKTKKLSPKRLKGKSCRWGSHVFFLSTEISGI